MLWEFLIVSRAFDKRADKPIQGTWPPHAVARSAVGANIKDTCDDSQWPTILNL